MGLFIKQPAATSKLPLYTIGAHQTKLVVGLGNPGKEYDGTRHNVGFATLDAFAGLQSNINWRADKSFKAEVAEVRIADTRVILAKPQTFMNLSGQAVQRIMAFYQVLPQDCVVIHDELDLNFGTIRTQLGGSSAGHNGIKSLIQHIGEDFGRLRIGVGPKNPPEIEGADFVLGKFSKAEKERMKPILNEALSMLNEMLLGKGVVTETRKVS